MWLKTLVLSILLFGLVQLADGQALVQTISPDSVEQGSWIKFTVTGLNFNGFQGDGLHLEQGGNRMGISSYTGPINSSLFIQDIYIPLDADTGYYNVHVDHLIYHVDCCYLYFCLLFGCGYLSSP